ncbi:Hypothetical protein polymerase III subunit Rpc31 [Nesidiocoris tenuis]|uniref:DNA-directed RNA polymerase III subunit n=1 Tax=Nesidiocoris tenuis TaxID=355587 RepID=A0ABN7BAE6_9HEMI|nr:Hypothetical protein polymerase III subunit Rpc31 [Nesidiocoris tenuis]
MAGGGGRGRGRAALSFNVEALGISPGEALPGPQVQPPPTYPLHENHPALLQPNSTFTNRLRYKLDFLGHFSNFKSDLGGKDFSIGQKRKASGLAVKPTQPLEFRWEFFPPELRPNAPKRTNGPKRSKVLKGTIRDSSKASTNVDEVLAALEKAESSGTVIKTEKEDVEDNNRNEEEDDEAFEDSDQEMDDGTDYNQNYFDNGDDYLDDDNDDDGPIY